VEYMLVHSELKLLGSLVVTQLVARSLLKCLGLRIHILIEERIVVTQ
jgi:hypothetical protein